MRPVHTLPKPGAVDKRGRRLVGKDEPWAINGHSKPEQGDEESLTSDATAALTQPLTATIHNPLDYHDGRKTFTFELRFSDDLKQSFSFKTLRDHAFTVTGGEVVRAKRLDKDGNVRWEIHVRPFGDGTVTIVLPATTGCDAQGAVCTSDGRMLSSGLELTVAGPSG